MASNRRTLEQRAHDWKCWPLASFKTGASRLNVTFYSARTTELFPPRVREDIGSYLCAKPGCLFACRSPLVRQTRFRKIGCGARRGSAQFKTMDHSAVFGATGWPPGAIGPFSLSAQTNVWLDEAIFRAPTIYCGSRELNEVLEISSVALLRLPRVRVARVSADL